ncbi:MAG: FHA domain-containing protein [Bacteriovoracaceae bacterium]
MRVEVNRHNKSVERVDLSPFTLNENGDVCFVLGRSDKALIQLDDRQVSREHAHIFIESGYWKIKTLKDPIILNGIEIREGNLENGDQLTVGPYNLVFAIDGEEAQKLKSEVKESPALTPMPTVEEGATETNLSSAPKSVETEAMQTETETSDDDFQGDQENFNFDNQEGSDFSSEEFSTGEEHGSSAEYSEDYSEDGYNEFDDYNDGMEVDSYEDSGDKTTVAGGFAKYFLEIVGEYAPYDHYTLEDNSEVVIGRHPDKCEVVLSDPEVSSAHAKVVRKGTDISIEDLNSGNGTLVNGERINKISLTNGDEVLIGSTSFSLKVKSSFLKEQAQSLMPVEENQEIEVEELVEIDEDLEEGLAEGEDFGGVELEQENSIIKKYWNDPKKRKIIIVLGALFAVLMLLPDDEPTKNTARKAPKKATPQETEESRKRKEKIREQLKLAREMAESQEYEQALKVIEGVLLIDSKNGEALTLKQTIQERFAEIEANQRRLREEEQKRIRKEKIAKYVEEAKELLKNREERMFNAKIDQIKELDPNNYDIEPLVMEMKAWREEQDKIAIEKAQKKAERDRQEKAFKPAQRYYDDEDWYRAILKLESFLDKENPDDDLKDKAQKMLTESKNRLKSLVSPLEGKAKSLLEGQDLKGAYEAYNEILKYDPTHRVALNEMNRIREVLSIRSKKVYREAIVSESLSLFDEAKEKFQEVQQISPSDSEYYKKATEKLKEYID